MDEEGNNCTFKIIIDCYSTFATINQIGTLTKKNSPNNLNKSKVHPMNNNARIVLD